MKKISIILFTIFVAILTYAQNTITFLGIPVDGNEQIFIDKLKQKGFTFDSSCDCYKGDFNDNESLVKIFSYKEKIHQILVIDAYATEVMEISDAMLISRFNTLLRQFKKHPNYIEREYNEEIPDGTFLYYDKLYNAGFYQKGTTDNYENNHVDIGIIKYRNLKTIYLMYSNLKNAPNGEDL